jgi:cytidine deaminase
MPTIVQLRELKAAARAAAARAYAPYSKFRVGAAILSASGRIFSGCNVENASYGLTCCAERNAIFGAIGSGEKRLRLRCVVVYTPTDIPAAPCGACRQVINEFGPDAQIISFCRGKGSIVSNVRHLLPDSFGPRNLT